MTKHRNTNDLTYAIAQGGAARDRAIAKIRAALRANDGMIVGTAEQLGCAPRTLRDWFAAHRDELQAYAAELRAKAGIVGPREPRTRTRKTLKN
jgi:hypothetical protein